MANKIVHSTAAEVEARKKTIAGRCVKAKVVGELPVRDAVTRESIYKGGTVRLDPGVPGQPGGTLLRPLVDAGVIELIDAPAA